MCCACIPWMVVNSIWTKTIQQYPCPLTIALKCTVFDTPSRKIKALQREARQRKRKAKAAKEGQIEEELLQYNDFCQKKGHDEVQYAIERYDDDIKTIRNSSSRRDSEECCYGGFREGLDHPIRNSKRGKKSLKKGKCTDAWCKRTEKCKEEWGADCQ